MVTAYGVQQISEWSISLLSMRPPIFIVWFHSYKARLVVSGALIIAANLLSCCQQRSLLISSIETTLSVDGGIDISTSRSALWEGKSISIIERPPKAFHENNEHWTNMRDMHQRLRRQGRPNHLNVLPEPCLFQLCRESQSRENFWLNWQQKEDWLYVVQSIVS